MKRVVLLLAMGLMIVLTGCNSDDAEGGWQESEAITTTSELTSEDSSVETISSDSGASSPMTETAEPQSEIFVTETQTAMQTDASLIETTVKAEEITTTKGTAPQLETIPDDSPIEEDTGDFGELFS